jgi:AhpD family alkylhydroperoxidase
MTLVRPSELPVFVVQTAESAPERAQPALRRLRDAVGMVPNLAGLMANSPALIEGFVGLREAFQTTSFTPLEREALSLANATENACRYCSAIHAVFAGKHGLAPEEIERIRRREDPRDARLAALVRLSRALIQQRGQLRPERVRAYLDAGFEPKQVLEVVLSVTLSTLANYAEHVTHAQPDEAIRAQYR